jgi:hypothetical protein
MDQIGSSYIALPDLIVCGAAIALIYLLKILPPNSLTCRVLAVLSGCMIVAIIMIIVVADNLSQAGVSELSMIGFLLAFGLFEWNDNRIKSKSHIAARSI